MSVNSWKRGTGLFGVGAVILLIIGLFVGDESSKAAEESAKDDKATTHTTEPPSPEEDAQECPNTWLIVHANNENNRWFGEGIQAIRNAETPEEAKEAAREWLSLVRRDPHLLKGAVSYFLDRDVAASSLVGEEGKCASPDAVSLTAEIELTIAEAKVTPDQAPANGVNSGTDANGNVVASSHEGISGDRDAVKVETKDGKTIWILARCGNPVIVGKPPVPDGPTDEPPPESEPKCPDCGPTTTTTEPKCPDCGPTTTTTEPKCPDCGTTTTTLKPKDPGDSTNNSPAIPEQPRKPSPSPDNQSEASKPPQKPVDTPTGCTGSCGEDPSFENPPTTAPPSSQPGRGSSNGGTNTTAPPTTAAPPPAPPTTAPPTTNPPPPPPGGF